MTAVPLPPPSVTLYWCPFCGRTEQVNHRKHVPFEQLGGPYCVGAFTPIGYTMTHTAIVTTREADQ
jgi:hypothetical protein